MLFELKKIKTTGNTPKPRRDHSAVLHNNVMFIFGGQGREGILFGDLTRLDLTSYKWEKVITKGTPPSPRSGHSAIVYKNKMIVYGGRQEQDEKGTDKILYTLDLTTFEWSQIKPSGKSPSSANNHSVALYKNTLFVFGGEEDEYSTNNNFSALNLDLNQWIPLKSNHKDDETLVDASSHTGLAIYNNKLIKFLGQAGYEGWPTSISILDLQNFDPHAKKNTLIWKNLNKDASIDLVGDENIENSDYSIADILEDTFFSLDDLQDSLFEENTEIMRTVEDFGIFDDKLVFFGGFSPSEEISHMLSGEIIVLDLEVVNNPKENPFEVIKIKNNRLKLAAHSLVQSGNQLILFGGLYTNKNAENDSNYTLSNNTYCLVKI